MGFDFKKTFNNFKKSVKDGFDKAVDYWAKKISDSSYTLKSIKEIDEIIKKSKTTNFKNEKTWEKKVFKHKTIVIFWDEKSDFFEDALVNLPILATKAFSENIIVRLATTNIKWLNLKEFWVKEIPSMVVFQEEKVYKIISSEKNIEKITKSFKMWIEEQIENFKT